MNTIFEILKSPKAQRNILAVALVAAIIFLRGCGGGSSIDEYKYEQNISSLQDSVRTYETKNGELVNEKLALVTERNDLKKYNKDLEEDIQYLKDNPIVVTKFITKIVHDTVWLQPEIDTTNITFNQDSSLMYVPFTWGDSIKHDENNYKIIEGSYIIEVDTARNLSTKEFKIIRDEIGISFTTGITENDNDQVEIFIKSNYPNFTPTKIDGALFDPRESDVIKKFFPPKRWAIGVYGGYGFYFDPSKVTVGSGIQVGVGVQYNFIQWHGKKK